jgi:hypothetical protein
LSGAPSAFVDLNGDVVRIEAKEEDAEEEGRDPEAQGHATVPLTSCSAKLLRKEDDEPQSDAKEDEGENNIHGVVLLQSCRDIHSRS